MNAAATDTRKEMTPVAQVSRRFPRHAAMKNLPQRWITMKKKKASTLHRWSEFTKWPGGRDMPPARAHDGQDAASDDDPDQADHGQHAEDVDPRGHEGRLAVGEQPIGRKGGFGGAAHPGRPLTRFCARTPGDAIRCRRSSASPLVPREGKEDGQDEDDDHEHDDDEVRHRESG